MIGRCKRRNGRRQADLGEKAPGSVKSGLNGFCHSAAQPLIYVGTGCGGILGWRMGGDCRVKSVQSGRVGGGGPRTVDSNVLVELPGELEGPCLEASLKSCPLKLFTSPPTRGKRRQSMTKTHRGLQGRRELPSQLFVCSLSFTFLGNAGSLVGMDVYPDFPPAEGGQMSDLLPGGCRIYRHEG